MKKIKSIKIGGHKIFVKYKKKANIINLGENWQQYNQINLNIEQEPSQLEVTLLHEIIHNVLSNSGYKYDKNNDTKVHSEKTVETIAQGLYQVLKDNKIIFNGKLE